jgi:hypothetical protein
VVAGAIKAAKAAIKAAKAAIKAAVKAIKAAKAATKAATAAIKVPTAATTAAAGKAAAIKAMEAMATNRLVAARVGARGSTSVGPRGVWGGAMRGLTGVVVCLAILVGVAGAAVVMGGRGGEDLFRVEQSRAQAMGAVGALSAARVEEVVRLAPEPVAAAMRTPPARVSCRPGAGGVLRNPWVCTIRYRSGTRAHYRVTVRPDGYYTGTGTGMIDGCCVKAPTFG